MKPVQRLRLAPREPYPRCDAPWAVPRNVQRQNDVKMLDPTWEGQDCAPSWEQRAGTMLRGLLPARGTSRLRRMHS
jgi:hypothetical protein